MNDLKTAVVLAAGKSRRFGENKLLARFCGKTLVEWTAEFLAQNGFERMLVTISRDGVTPTEDGRALTHPIVSALAKYRDRLDVRFAFQSPDEYGPAAALRPWRGLSERFITLFGDNFYWGDLSYVEEYFDADCVVSTISRSVNARNLQLSVVVNGTLIEKPHGVLSGDYFCGFVVFTPVVWDFIDGIEISGRGEYEITNLVNEIENRVFVENRLIWSDVTYKKDIDQMSKIVEMATGGGDR